MIIYQIFVKGYTDCLDDIFKCHSQKVYKRKPTDEEIKEFITVCSEGQMFNLDIDKPYKTYITELELID